LAAVVAHEIGHVIAQHGAERMSTSLATEIGLKAVEIAAGAAGQPLGQGAVSALGMGAQYGIVLPYGRTQESEADRIGLDLMARAGFDPTQAITLWQNMGKLDGSSPPEFLSTHPSGQSRMADLNAHMSNALAAARAANQAGNNPSCD
jgi:predicted Zn-dependent protease